MGRLDRLGYCECFDCCEYRHRGVTVRLMDSRPTRHHPVLLAPEDVEAAGASARLLRQALEPTPAGPDSVRLLMEEPVEQQIVLPAAAARLLAEMLAELANGNAVSVVPLQAELTTQQAADLLGVSRPYLIGLLEQGRIEHRRVGNRRRVPVADLLRFQHEENERTRAAVAALTEQAEELGLGYEG